MSRVAIILAVAAYIVVIESTPFHECPGLPPPVNLRINGCDELPCKLHMGQNATAEWDFDVIAPTNKLVPKATAHLALFSVKYPLGQENACNSLINGECPLDKDEQVTYSLNMPVPSIFFPIELNIQFEILDGNGNTQVCFIVPSKVV